MSITTNNGFPGNASLDGLVPGSTRDSASLTFKFTAETNSVNFEYIFASDEYNEFTNSSFNDVFGFFLNGVNVATIPGSSTVVSINNVNGGNPLGVDASNPAFFKNNDLNDGGPFFDIEYDGFTVAFSVLAELNPGENEIELAIADVGDSIYDSAVFIAGNTFQGELPGTSPGNPLLPDMIGDDGSFIFDDTSIFNTDEFLYIDPVVAVGYEYNVAGANFTELLLPTGIGDNSYNLLLDNSGGSCSGFSPSGDVLTGGIAFSFASPTPCFAVDGIEVSAALDPTDPLAFVAGIKLDATGVFDITQTPIVENSEVPEPLTLLGAATAVGFMARFKKHLGHNSYRNS